MGKSLTYVAIQYLQQDGVSVEGVDPEFRHLQLLCPVSILGSLEIEQR